VLLAHDTTDTHGYVSRAIYPEVQMTTRLIPALAVATALASTLVASTLGASAAPAPPSTPNSCIALNGGDWNACNVGNNGRGNLPYKPYRQSSPNQCITLNSGDWNACNVGNSGRGDLPYQHAGH